MARLDVCINLSVEERKRVRERRANQYRERFRRDYANAADQHA